MRKSSSNISDVKRILLIALKRWKKLPRNSFELKVSVKSFSCWDLNGKEVIRTGNKLSATGKARHVCFGNLAQGLGDVEVKQKSIKTKFGKAIL